VFLAWTLLYFLAYSVLGVSRYFWYYAPLVPGFVVVLGLGISQIKEVFSSNGKHSEDIKLPNPLSSPFPRPWWSGGNYLTIAIIITIALMLILGQCQAKDLWTLRQHPDNRLVIYEVVGEWLREHTPSGASIGTLEVGIIGFYAERRMIDFAGLVQPQVSNQLTKNTTYEDAALWAVEHFHPDYLVLHNNNFPRLEQGYVIQHCNMIQDFLGKAYGYSTDIIVYACK
jgi:hypothetical protein